MLMNKNFMKKAMQYLPLVLMVLGLLACCTFAFADVGNQNRYSGGGGGLFDGGDGDFGIGFLVGLLFRVFPEHPVLGMLILILIIVLVILKIKKNKKKGSDPNLINQRLQTQARSEITHDNSTMVTAQIQAIDPAFSSDKFIGFAREVFMTIQAAWTAKDWKPIRPFESEALFNMHKQQLDEYIRLGKTNVVEKIGIKHCSLHEFRQDGDKEVLVVWLNAVMRDYVIDDATKKVLESDPNRDWLMHYEMVFNRKAGLKTDPGKKGNSITNCPNCGAPTEVTSSGQCTYCGSVITNGEHDWVLTDIHSR